MTEYNLLIKKNNTTARLTPYLEHPQASYILKEKLFLMPCFFLREHRSERQIYFTSFFFKKNLSLLATWNYAILQEINTSMYIE